MYIEISLFVCMKLIRQFLQRCRQILIFDSLRRNWSYPMMVFHCCIWSGAVFYEGHIIILLGLHACKIAKSMCLISKIKPFTLWLLNWGKFRIWHEGFFIMWVYFLELCYSLEDMSIICWWSPSFVIKLWGLSCSSDNIIRWEVSILGCQLISPFQRLHIWIVFDRSLVSSDQRCYLRPMNILVDLLLFVQVLKLILDQCFLTLCLI